MLVVLACCQATAAVDFNSDGWGHISFSGTLYIHYAVITLRYNGCFNHAVESGVSVFVCYFRPADEFRSGPD